MAWSRKRRWTDEQLREAIASSTSFRLAADRLMVHGEDSVRRRALELRLPIEHFERQRQSYRRWTSADLIEAVRCARSFADVLRGLNLVAAGGNYEHIHRRIDALGLDTSHFRKTSWNAGLRLRPTAVPLPEVLVRGRWTSSHRLKLRLITTGIKPAHCELCGWAQRAPDGRLPLELDHINGDKTDNRIENLRIICPNCHALQPTHRGLNQKRRRT